MKKFDFLFKNPTEKVVDYIKKELEVRDERIKFFKDKFDTFNKDEEIQKERDLVNDISRHSLYIMSNKEKEDIKDFEEKHRLIHIGNSNDYEMKFHQNLDFWYQIGRCSLGQTIKIKCPVCGEIKDITDISAW